MQQVRKKPRCIIRLPDILGIAILQPAAYDGELNRKDKAIGHRPIAI